MKKDKTWNEKMGNYFENAKMPTSRSKPPQKLEKKDEVQIYLNEAEKELTARADPTANKMLTDVFKNITELGYQRALEVACGDGLTTKNVLVEKF